MKDSKGRFVKGNEPHNKGKNKENYEPLKMAGEKCSIKRIEGFKQGTIIHPMLGKTKSQESIQKSVQKNIENGHYDRLSIVLKKKYEQGLVSENFGFKKGYTPWNYELTKENNETIKRLAEEKFGKPIHNVEFKEQKRNEMLGNKYAEGNESWNKELSKEELKKHYINGWKGIFEKGHIPWNFDENIQRDYGLDFTLKFKEKIRERENFCCIICNKHETEIIRKLDIHHIDYNKLNSFIQNCVGLCISCHVKTNFNRQQWKTFFQSLLKERYNYQYTEEQKIILDYTNLETSQ